MAAEAPPIIVDDESDHHTIDLCSDSDVDTADKLESYDKKPSPNNGDEDEAHTVSLSLTDSMDQAELCEDWADEDKLEISFISNEAAVSDKVGLTGENRKLVISAC